MVLQRNYQSRMRFQWGFRDCGSRLTLAPRGFGHSPLGKNPGASCAGPWGPVGQAPGVASLLGSSDSGHHSGVITAASCKWLLKTCLFAIICLVLSCPRHSPLTVKHILIDCTCVGAACQRYLGVDTHKELFEHVESRNIVVFMKDTNFYHIILLSLRNYSLTHSLTTRR